KIVGGHLTLHASENRMLIQRALMRSGRDVGDSRGQRRQTAPQHQQAGADEPAVGVRRIHHLDQPDRDQDPRPVTPDVVNEKYVQVVEQEQQADADHDQRRNDAWNVTSTSPIFMWLHDVSVRRRRPRVPRKSANTRVLPASTREAWGICLLPWSGRTACQAGSPTGILRRAPARTPALQPERSLHGPLSGLVQCVIVWLRCQSPTFARGESPRRIDRGTATWWFLKTSTWTWSAARCWPW